MNPIPDGTSVDEPNKFLLNFSFNSKNRLNTIVEAKMNDEEINLSNHLLCCFYITMKQKLTKKILIFHID